MINLVIIQATSRLKTYLTDMINNAEDIFSAAGLNHIQQNENNHSILIRFRKKGIPFGSVAVLLGDCLGFLSSPELQLSYHGTEFLYQDCIKKLLKVVNFEYIPECLIKRKARLKNRKQKKRRRLTKAFKENEKLERVLRRMKLKKNRRGTRSGPYTSNGGVTTTGSSSSSAIDVGSPLVGLLVAVQPMMTSHV
jgi:hypothetical protein